MSLFQCVVLMLFNDAEKLSYEDIASKSGLEEKELKRALQSLACAKVRILNKEPKSRDVNAGDVFEVNAALNERLFRIKVNSIQIKETTEENKQTMERVFQDRQQQVDAAIVRVMKTRKSLTHALLDLRAHGAAEISDKGERFKEAHRESHRARVHRARPRGRSKVQLPRVDDDAR